MSLALKIGVTFLGLTADAQRVLDDLMTLGAVPTSGHRSVAGQARAMAVNIVKVTYDADGNAVLHRDFIGRTYKHGRPLQTLIDAHPEWVTVAKIGEELYREMGRVPELAKGLSHHLEYPCPCFDLDPKSITAPIRTRIAGYMAEGVITKILWEEGGLPKCHVECAVSLPDIKSVEV